MAYRKFNIVFPALAAIFTATGATPFANAVDLDNAPSGTSLGTLASAGEKRLPVRGISCKKVGGPKIDEAFVMAHVSFKPGDEFSPLALSNSIRALYATGLFEYITAEPILDAANKCADVEISYIAFPLLTGIYFEGNKEWGSGTASAPSDHETIIVNYYKDEAQKSESSFFNFFRGNLMKECDDANLRVGRPLDKVLVKRAEAKIRKKYEKKFPFAEISHKIKTDEENGTATVTFFIEENLNTRISEITLKGNKAFSDKTLRDIMQTSTWAYFFDLWEWPTNRFLKFSAIRDLGRFNYEMLKRDVATLVKFYQNSGFLDVQIYPQTEEELKNGYSEVNNEETEGCLPLEIQIDEGRQYFIDEIAVDGNKLGEEHARFADSAILAMLAQYSPRGARRGDSADFDLLFPGMAYSPSALDVACDKIREYYGQVGYLDCKVAFSREPDFETGKVKVKFTITEGEKSYMRSVRVEGNTITKSEVILRDLVLAPGEVFDLVRMKRSEARLKNESYFRQPQTGESSVSVHPAETGVPGQRDMVVSVREAPTGSLQFGGGFSTVESLNAFVEFSQSNFDLFNSQNYFRGGGQKFRFRIQVGVRSSSIEQSLEEPRIFGREIRVGYEAYHKSNSYVSSSYKTVDTGIKIYGARRLVENVYGELYYKIDNYQITNVDSTVPEFIRDEEGYTLLSRGGLRLSRDMRDRYLFPNSGSNVAVTNEIVGGPFGGDCTYYRFRADAAKWFPIFDFQDQTLKLRARMDTTHALGSSYVPFFERIMYGGPYNLRGFRYAYVSPFQGDEPMGGNSGAFVSVEYMIKLLDQLRFALFYDGGFVNSDSFDFSPRDWCDDFGFGFRMLVMGALLNIDIGFPLHTTKDNDDGMRFQISFGTNF